MPPVPSSGLQQRMERYRPRVVEEMRAVVGEGAAGLFAWMRYHLGWEDAAGNAVDAPPGKMLRSTALLLAAEIVGGPSASGPFEAALPAAAAVELVHNFSLLHDDVEDGTERRRGRATLWTVTGTAQAINTGDGMYTLARLAMHRLLESGIEERRVVEAMRELDEACLRLVEGQYLDLLFETRRPVSRDEYLAMASGKTAAMFAAPFAIGALLGGADGRTVSALREFGRHIGLAFQAVDDLLGIWGDPATTGKPVGDDLRSRKMTLAVVTALSADGEDARALARAYAEPPDPQEDISHLAALVERLGGRAATESFAAEQAQAARAALDAGALDADAIALCTEYGDLVVRRDT